MGNHFRFFLELELITHCNPVMDCNTFPEERKMLLSCNQGDLISTVVAEAGARDRTPIAKMLLRLCPKLGVRRQPDFNDSNLCCKSRRLLLMS